jgi:phage gp16-like protein
MNNDQEYRRKALAKIHIAKKELGLTEEEYRDVIAGTVPGKESAADLDDHELHLLVDRFSQLGWRPRIRRDPSRPLPPMVWKARRLWLDLYEAGAVKNPQWTALARFAKRMTGVGDLRRLNAKQGTVVIEALKQWLDRVGPKL